MSLIDAAVPPETCISNHLYYPSDWIYPLRLSAKHHNKMNMQLNVLVSSTERSQS